MGSSMIQACHIASDSRQIDWDAESCDLQDDQVYCSMDSTAKKGKMSMLTASKNIWNFDGRARRPFPRCQQVRTIPIKRLKTGQPTSNEVKSIIEKVKSCRFQRIAYPSLKIDPSNFYKIKSTPIQKDYTLLQQIGSGSYGKVYKAQSKSDEQFRAVKLLDKKKMNPSDILSFINEFHHLKQLNHPNIIKLFDMYKDENHYYIVTQLCQGGSLLNFILNFKMKETIAHSVVMQILGALNYLHSLSILHRDIKLENIVLVKKIEANQMNAPQIKIIDFGLSQYLKEKQVETDTYLGTIMYMPPEGLEGFLTTSWDIWSLGILIFIMMSNDLPYSFKTNEDLIAKIIKGEINYQAISLKVDPLIIQFIRSCLKNLPCFRPTPSSLLNHPWMKKYNEGNLNKTTRRRTIINLTTYEIKDNLTNLVESYLTTKKMQQEQRQDLAYIFNKIDKNKSGFISMCQIKQLFGQQTQCLDQNDIKQIFSRICQQKKTQLNFHEFVTIMRSREKLYNKKALEEAFDFFDETEKGHLSKTKVKRLLKGAEQQEVQHIFYKLDQNEDNKIEKEEFIQYMERNQEEDSFAW